MHAEFLTYFNSSQESPNFMVHENTTQAQSIMVSDYWRTKLQTHPPLPHPTPHLDNPLSFPWLNSLSVYICSCVCLFVCVCVCMCHACLLSLTSLSLCVPTTHISSFPGLLSGSRATLRVSMESLGL